MMFAIIEDSGTQFRVEPGQTLVVDLRDDVEPGQSITFDRVMLANAGGASVIGAPVIEGATVTGTVVDPLFKGPKLEVVKYRRRKASKRHTGHRQKYTTVLIEKLSVPGLQVVEAPAASAEAAQG